MRLKHFVSLTQCDKHSIDFFSIRDENKIHRVISAEKWHSHYINKSISAESLVPSAIDCAYFIGIAARTKFLLNAKVVEFIEISKLLVLRWTDCLAIIQLLQIAAKKRVKVLCHSIVVCVSRNTTRLATPMHATHYSYVCTFLCGEHIAIT